MDNKKNNFNLDLFKKTQDTMIATNDRAYNNDWNYNNYRIKHYTLKEIESIIETGSLLQQQKLSQDYFNQGGFYSRIIIHYATLLKYTGMLIPNPSFGKTLSSSFIQKKYYNALNYIEKMNISSFCINCALQALINGSYYGIILEQTKDKFVILDLPSCYCRSNFKDDKGNDLIEFDVSYFNTILNTDSRNEALKAYPKIISDYYKKYRTGKVKNKWIFIPSDIGICFSMYNGTPFFLKVVPATIEYDDARDTERERDLEEIRKIIVQKIPHLSDGGFLLEPEEAEEIHRGAVGMMKGNKNISVLTTYADVDSIVSKTAADTSSNNLERMVDNIYCQGGVSGQLFASNSQLSLGISIKNDMAMMMPLIKKMELFITNIINKNFSNSNVSFKYIFLPVTYYNDTEFVDTSLKMANSGYSFILPALAMGLSQQDLSNVKDLENDVLKLADKLIPLTTAYTQSTTAASPGAPEKAPEEKAPKTVKNEISLDKGGSE